MSTDMRPGRPPWCLSSARPQRDSRSVIVASIAAGFPTAFRGFPPAEYANRDEVARSVPTRPASDRQYTPAQRAEQARRRQLSQYQRDVPKPAVQDELHR
jgi:hypothetical protein